MKTFLDYLNFKGILVTLILDLVCYVNANAQSPVAFPTSGSVSYTINNAGSATYTGGTTGNFISFTAAAASLKATANAAVILTGPITFTVAAGETFNELPVTISYTNPGHQSITFITSNSSNPDPVLIAVGGTGTNDAILTILGGSNYIFNGIDLLDISTINTTAVTEMEYGLWLEGGLNGSGCSNDTYENSTITLVKTNSNTTYCVYVLSNATGTLFSNNNNSFSGNNLQNSQWGYNFVGNSTYPDQGNSINSNTIKNLNSGFRGIGYANQQNLSIFNNSINNMTNVNLVAYAINCSSGSSSTANIFNNTIGASSGSITTTSGAIAGIYLQAGSANVYNNIIRNLSASGSGAVTGILFSPSIANITNNVYGNSITLLSSSSNGIISGINYASSTNPITANIYNNTINSLTTASTSAIYGIYNSSGNAAIIFNVFGNSISTLTGTSTASTGILAGINFVSTGSGSIYSNTISNISTASSGSQAISGILISGTNINNLFCNYISNISGSATNGTVSPTGINYSNSTATSTNNIYGNTINNIFTSSTAAPKVTGMIIGGNQTNNIFKNLIYNISTISTTSGTAVGLQLTATSSNNIYNNMISDIRANAAGTATTAGGGAKGLNITGVATTTRGFKIYYNSIYLGGASTSSTQQSTAFFSTDQTFAGGLDFENNIFVNNYEGSFAKAYAFWYSSTSTITPSGISSNTTNNFFYTNGATSGSQYFILNTGTNTGVAQILSAYRSSTIASATSDATTSQTIGGTPAGSSGGIFASFFVNSVSTPYDIHLNPTSGTSGAIDAIIQGSTGLGVPFAMDIDGDARATSGNTTIGADEPCSTSAPSTPAFTASPSPVCQGSTSQAYTVTNVPGVTYNWSIPPGITLVSAATSNTVSLNFPTILANGGYIISVTASNGCGVSLPAIASVTVNAGVTSGGSISGPAGVCPNTNGYVYSTTAIPGASGYSWSVPASFTLVSGQGTQAITVNSGSAPTGTFTIAGVDACGNTSTITSPFVVNSNPTVVASSGISSPNGSFVCLNGTGYVYTAAAIPFAANYQWTVPAALGSITGGQGSGSITVTAAPNATAQTISVVGINACGTTSDSSATFNVLVPSITASGTIVGSSIICLNTSSIVYSTAPIANAVSYNWTVPVGATIVGAATNNSISVSFSGSAVAGNITVTGVSAAPCSTGPVATFPITVNTPTSASAGITTTNGAVVCSSETGIIYSAAAIPGAANYSWIVPSTVGSIVGTSNGASINVTTVASPTGGTITVSGINACGTIGNSTSYTVGGPTPASLSGNQTITCIGSTTQFSAPQASASGGTVTTVGGYRIHTFTATGTVNSTYTFTPAVNMSVDYLVMGGGGAGGVGPNDGNSGGGGAGGYRCTMANEQSGGRSFPEAQLALTAGVPVNISVGGGGSSSISVNNGVSTSVGNGNPSSFGTIISYGGGVGGNWNNGSGSGGGSGGGGGQTGSASSGGAGTTNQGFSGGSEGANYIGAAGGGGVDSVGLSSFGTNSQEGGRGGAGIASSITGTSVKRGGGGGGSSHGNGVLGIAGGASVGGAGGGGNGHYRNGGPAGPVVNATAGADGTGGGGGGGGENTPDGNGGSGIVIVRYPDISVGTWSSSNTNIATVNSSTGVVTGIAAGTSIITYTYTPSNGTCVLNATRTVSVAALTASASGTTPLCSGSALTLTGATNAGVATYSWAGPNGFTSSAQSPIINNPGAANSGTYTLNVTNAACSTTATAVVVIHPTPVTNQTKSICAGQSITVGTNIHNIAETYTDDIYSASAFGCDSMVTTNLKVLFNISAITSTFTKADIASGSSGCRGATTADFNGDGKLDIFVNNYIPFGGNATLLLNNGSGGYTRSIIPVANSNEMVGIDHGDFNGDGKPDIVMTNGFAVGVSILLNTGGGTFNPATNISMGSNPQPYGPAIFGVVVSDYNRDGKADLLVGSAGLDSVFFFQGNGDGTFKQAKGYPTGGSSVAIVAADFNGDGFLDFASANSANSTNPVNGVSVLLGNGLGGFGTPLVIPFPSGANTIGITSGDYDNDGKVDLAICNHDSNNVYVYKGNGSGGFTQFAGSPYRTGPTATLLYSITSGDYNGDGNLDLAVAGSGTNNIAILKGAGTGAFNTITYVSIGGDPNDIITSDLNADGRPDIVTANYSAGNISVVLNSTPSVNTSTATSNSPVCGNTTLNLTGGASGWTSYSWAGPNGFTSSQQSPSLVNPTSAAAGTYTLTVKDVAGCTSSVASATVTINVVTPVITPATPVCANSVSNVYSTANGKTNYVWTITGGSIVSATTNSSSTVTWGTPGTGHIRVNYTDVNGCAAASPTDQSITINSLPTPSVSESDNSGTGANDGKICNLDVITLNGLPANGLTYNWSAGLGTNQSVTDNPSANTTYTLTVTDVNGCTATANTSVTVNALPPVAVTPTSAVCTGLTTAVLTASGATGYTWAPSTNLTTTNGGITETAQISSLTFYTLTGTDANQCSKSVTIPVATVPTGGISTPIFSIICSGGTQTLTVTGAAGHDYVWQISSDNVNWTNISGATNTTYTTTSGDGITNKFYRLMAQSNSCWNVASTTAEVDVSQPVITVTAGNITDNSLTLSWSPTGTGNYAISYSGTSSATQTSVTPSKTITGLTANGTYSITVTQTGIAGCSASGTLTGVNTLCAMPTGVTLNSPANAQILVSWNGVPGADYRVYYRPLFAFGYYFTKDVSGVSSALITKQGNNNIYGSTTYEVYVSRLDCPTTGAVGQGTNPTNVTTLPAVSCPTPVIDSVRSLCPVQIEVFMHPGLSPTNSYNIYLQRITPTILAVNSYGLTGNYFTINVPYSGDIYLIAADSKCAGGAQSRLYVFPGNVTVKPICNSPANLVLSNPTCHGFAASWNDDQCLSNSASGYDIYLRTVGTINYNSYGVALPANGIGPNKQINWLTAGRNYQVFVRSVYNCNGFSTYGPPSQTQTIATLSGGCRDDEDTRPQEAKPAVQQYSPDNQEVFSLYPNPNTGEFAVDLSRYDTEEDAVRIEVINLIGQTVATHLTTISGGHMSEYITLPKGTAASTYIVRLTAGKNVYTAKINVSK